MSTSTPPDNTVLKLKLPSPIVRTESVEGAAIGAIGMPMAAFDASEIVDSAAVTIYPPSAGTVNKGDIMELWLEDEEEALDTKPVIDPNAIITAHIHKSRMHADRENWLFYTFRRDSNNLGTSPSLSILYNRIRPGLKDRYDSPGGHSELKLFLPDEIKNGVGPDFVSAEVCVAYPYCRAYDLITLKCNGEILKPKPKVDANQAPPPPNPGDETPITICFTVTRAFLVSAHRQNKKLEFSYTVTDQLGNGPDRDATWSPVQTVAEDLAGELLPKPILRELLDDPSDDPNFIDLEKLNGKPLWLVVVPTDNRFVVGYDVVATYTAKIKGQPDVGHRVEGTVEKDQFGVKQPLFLQVPNEKVLAGSVVTVTYELYDDKILVASSNPAEADVKGTPPVDLKPPFLVAPAVDPIDVLAYPVGVKMRIEFPEALSGDKARLVEVNPPADSSPFPLVPFNINKRVNTVLSPAFLAARHGKVIELRWNLNRNDAQIGRSPNLPVNILKIADGDARLPTPSIAGNTTNQLNVTQLNAIHQTTVDAWFHAPKETLWLGLEGTNRSGQKVHLYDLEGEQNPSSEGLTKNIPLAWLQALGNGTELVVRFYVNFKGDQNLENRTEFPNRTYSIQAQARLNDFTNFANLQRNGWVDGYAIRDPRDWTYQTFRGYTSLTNSTHTNNSSGSVLQKTYTNLIPGQTYEFSLLACNGTWQPVARLVFRSDYGTIIPQFAPPNEVWASYSGSFVAQATQMRFEFINNESTGAGNDYFLTNLHMREV